MANKGKILVVDDDRLVLATWAHGLSQAGYDVIDTDNGDDAILMAREHKPDLALLDIRMEGMSGADFAMAVRANANARIARTPILMMTGDPNVAEVRTQGQKAGINAFVRKPVSCAQLMTLVDTILPRNS